MTSSTPIPTTIDPSDADLLCPDCGYDLRGIPISRCPECGMTLDAAALARSQIPWTHRWALNTWRAFARTAGLVIIRPGEIARDIARPVELADALAFRRRVVRVAMMPYAAIAVYAYWQYLLVFFPARALSPPPEFNLWQHPWAWLADVMMIPVAWLGGWLFFTFAAGVASYFFHPSSLSLVRQNRAIALSYYASAPMCPVPWIYLGCIALIELESVFEPRGSEWQVWAIAYLLASILMVGALGAWWRSTLVLLRRTTGCGVARVLTAGALLPVLWLILFALTMIALPAAYFFVELILSSMQP
jgi:hypothetical protein